jgi:hypothetical protein
MMEEPGIQSTKTEDEMQSDWESEGASILDHRLLGLLIWYLARRLHWLQTFTRLERWKEEMLLVDEEMCRVGKWYLFTLAQAEAKVRTWLDAACNRERRGFHALLCENARRIRMRYQRLPDAIRRWGEASHG